MNLQQPVLLAGHLEFGDALVMNGMVRVLAKTTPRLVLMARPRYYHSVRRMHADLKNVRVIPVEDYTAAAALVDAWGDNAIRLGFFQTGNFDEPVWDKAFYDQAGLPFDCRWTEFDLAETLPAPKHVVALGHEDYNRGFILRGVPHVFHITQRPCILDWLPEVLGAEELHCIDSAFLNLAESLYAMGHLTSTKLVFHRYAKIYPGPARWPTLRAPWRVLE